MVKDGFESLLKNAREDHGIVGREAEIRRLWLALSAGRNVLLEGPVGVGKTVLAQAVAQALSKKVVRIDGDGRFTEQKLVGSFDPATVMKRGYSAKTFLAGPLVQAMRDGSILFINELNRMPESVQNVLLPALDEGMAHVPMLGTVKAKPGFLLVATQNPREFVATSHLSEAMLDRVEWIPVEYQSFEEEREIVRAKLSKTLEPWTDWAVHLARITRSHPKIKRGASVRAAIAVLKILEASRKAVVEDDFWAAVRPALPTRIELQAGMVGGSTYAAQIENLLKELSVELKKNS